jgi:hypothetical protein
MLILINYLYYIFFLFIIIFLIILKIIIIIFFIIIFFNEYYYFLFILFVLLLIISIYLTIFISYSHTYSASISSSYHIMKNIYLLIQFYPFIIICLLISILIFSISYQACFSSIHYSESIPISIINIYKISITSIIYITLYHIPSSL